MGHIGRVSDSLPNMLISPFFSGALLYMTDQKDLNMLLNFWINEQAFIILFQCFNSMSGYRDISLQSWSSKWAKDDHFQWAKFNHFHIVRKLLVIQTWNS